ncbi:MAG TPA: hypothetical protein VIM46_08590 [Luteolibacter sp.]
MKHCRNLLYGFAFLLGWLCLFHLAMDLDAAFADSSLLLFPLLIGLGLALTSARSLVAKQWSKGPAFLLAAATFARLSLARGMQIGQLQHRADSWFDVALGLAIDLGWMGLVWLLSAVVYRSADRIFAAIGRALTHRIRSNASGKVRRS